MEGESPWIPLGHGFSSGGCRQAPRFPSAVSAQVFGRSCCERTRFKSEMRPGQSFCSGFRAASAIWGASDYNCIHGNSFLPTSYSVGRAINEMWCLEGGVKEVETVGMTVKTLKGENI